jgi:hypothetical protein
VVARPSLSCEGVDAYQSNSLNRYSDACASMPVSAVTMVHVINRDFMT